MDGQWSLVDGGREDDDGVRFVAKVARQVAASSDGSLMMEAKEPMLSDDFLKSGWFLMAEAQVTLVAIVMIVLVAKEL